VGDVTISSAAVTVPFGPTAMWAFVPPLGAGTSVKVVWEGVILPITWLFGTSGSQVDTAAVPSAPIAARTNWGLPRVAIVKWAPNASAFGAR
jgi:hypothetical protein